MNTYCGGVGSNFLLKRGWGWVRGMVRLINNRGQKRAKTGMVGSKRGSKKGQKGVQNDPKKGHFGPLFGPLFGQIWRDLAAFLRGSSALNLFPDPNSHPTFFRGGWSWLRQTKFDPSTPTPRKKVGWEFGSGKRFKVDSIQRFPKNGVGVDFEGSPNTRTLYRDTRYMSRPLFGPLFDHLVTSSYEV